MEKPSGASNKSVLLMASKWREERLLSKFFSSPKAAKRIKSVWRFIHKETVTSTLVNGFLTEHVEDLQGCLVSTINEHEMIARKYESEIAKTDGFFKSFKKKTKLVAADRWQRWVDVFCAMLAHNAAKYRSGWKQGEIIHCITQLVNEDHALLIRRWAVAIAMRYLATRLGGKGCGPAGLTVEDFELIMKTLQAKDNKETTPLRSLVLIGTGGIDTFSPLMASTQHPAAKFLLECLAHVADGSTGSETVLPRVRVDEEGSVREMDSGFGTASMLTRESVGSSFSGERSTDFVASIPVLGCGYGKQLATGERAHIWWSLVKGVLIPWLFSESVDTNLGGEWVERFRALKSADRKLKVSFCRWLREFLYLHSKEVHRLLATEEDCKCAFAVLEYGLSQTDVDGWSSCLDVYGGWFDGTLTLPPALADESSQLAPMCISHVTPLLRLPLAMNALKRAVKVFHSMLSGRVMELSGESYATFRSSLLTALLEWSTEKPCSSGGLQTESSAQVFAQLADLVFRTWCRHDSGSEDPAAWASLHRHLQGWLVGRAPVNADFLPVLLAEWRVAVTRHTCALIEGLLPEKDVSKAKASLLVYQNLLRCVEPDNISKLAAPWKLQLATALLEASKLWETVSFEPRASVEPLATARDKPMGKALQMLGSSHGPHTRRRGLVPRLSASSPASLKDLGFAAQAPVSRPAHLEARPGDLCSIGPSSLLALYWRWLSGLLECEEGGEEATAHGFDGWIFTVKALLILGFCPGSRALSGQLAKDVLNVLHRSVSESAPQVVATTVVKAAGPMLLSSDTLGAWQLVPAIVGVIKRWGLASWVKVEDSVKTAAVTFLSSLFISKAPRTEDCPTKRDVCLLLQQALKHPGNRNSPATQLHCVWALFIYLVQEFQRHPQSPLEPEDSAMLLESIEAILACCDATDFALGFGSLSSMRSLSEWCTVIMELFPQVVTRILDVLAVNVEKSVVHLCMVSEPRVVLSPCQNYSPSSPKAGGVSTPPQIVADQVLLGIDTLVQWCLQSSGDLDRSEGGWGRVVHLLHSCLAGCYDISPFEAIRPAKSETCNSGLVKRLSEIIATLQDSEWRICSSGTVFPTSSSVSSAPNVMRAAVSSILLAANAGLMKLLHLFRNDAEVVAVGTAPDSPDVSLVLFGSVILTVTRVGISRCRSCGALTPGRRSDQQELHRLSRSGMCPFPVCSCPATGRRGSGEHLPPTAFKIVSRDCVGCFAWYCVPVYEHQFMAKDPVKPVAVDPHEVESVSPVTTVIPPAEAEWTAERDAPMKRRWLLLPSGSENAAERERIFKSPIQALQSAVHSEFSDLQAHVPDPTLLGGGLPVTASVYQASETVVSEKRIRDYKSTDSGSGFGTGFSGATTDSASAPAVPSSLAPVRATDGEEAAPFVTTATPVLTELSGNGTVGEACGIVARNAARSRWKESAFPEDLPEEEKKRQLLSLSKFECILRDPIVEPQLLEFVKGEFASESLLFWHHVEDFRATECAEKRREKASLMVDRFVDDNAADQVNLPSSVFAAIAKRIEEGDYGSDLFDAAQFEVERLMEKDSLSRFIRQRKAAGTLPRVLRLYGEIMAMEKELNAYEDQEAMLMESSAFAPLSSCSPQEGPPCTCEDSVSEALSALRNLLGTYGWIHPRLRDHVRIVQELEKTSRLSSLIDSESPREEIKMALLYAPNGNCTETEMLRISETDPMFLEFARSMGREGPSATVVHSSFSCRTTFAVAPWMPSETEADRDQKRRSLRFLPVHVVWQAGFGHYSPYVFDSRFSMVHIIVRPLESVSNCFSIHIRTRKKLPEFGPLMDGIVVSGESLGPLTALNASRNLRSMQSDMRIPPHGLRQKRIDEFVRQFTVPAPDVTVLNLLYRRDYEQCVAANGKSTPAESWAESPTSRIRAGSRSSAIV